MVSPSCENPIFKVVIHPNLYSEYSKMLQNQGYEITRSEKITDEAVVIIALKTLGK